MSSMATIIEVVSKKKMIGWISLVNKVECEFTK